MIDYFFQLTDLSITGNVRHLLRHLSSLSLESVSTLASRLTHTRSFLYLCVTFHERDCSQNTQVAPILSHDAVRSLQNSAMSFAILSGRQSGTSEEYG